MSIDTGDKKSSKAIYDVIFRHRNEIEQKVARPINWYRNDDHQSCGLNMILENVDYRNVNDWPIIAEFHAKSSKELADYAFYPFQDEIAAIQ